MSETIHITSITQAHDAVGLPKPKHPLVSLVYDRDIQISENWSGVKIVADLYQVFFKLGACGTLTYGRNSYDYQEGTLLFTSPGQAITYENDMPSDSGVNASWRLAFHPDLIRKSALAAAVDQYSFFNYDVTEALHLSDKERQTIEELLEKITMEYSQNIDKHSQHLICSTIQLILDYCTRFYDRQFIMRKNMHADVVANFQRLLREYYASGRAADLGIPTVAYCASALHFSTNYFSDLLKKETGKSAKEHIHAFLIEQAKNKLLSTSHSIKEIGYALGFDYPTHFSNLFKAKTGYSPRDYRNLN